MLINIHTCNSEYGNSLVLLMTKRIWPCQCLGASGDQREEKTKLDQGIVDLCCSTEIEAHCKRVALFHRTGHTPTWTALLSSCCLAGEGVEDAVAACLSPAPAPWGCHPGRADLVGRPPAGRWSGPASRIQRPESSSEGVHSAGLSDLRPPWGCRRRPRMTDRWLLPSILAIGGNRKGWLAFFWSCRKEWITCRA
jgi:hypothetical protein